MRHPELASGRGREELSPPQARLRFPINLLVLLRRQETDMIGPSTWHFDPRFTRLCDLAWVPQKAEPETRAYAGSSSQGVED